VKIFQCDGIIFDLDGVLVDSSSSIERHWWKWTKKHGLDPEKTLHATLGMTTVEGIRLIAPHLDAEVEADEIDRAEAIDTDGVTAFDGAKGLLQAIPKDWWGVATSGTRDTATARMRAAGLMIPDVLTSANDVERGKPDPEPFLRTAQLLKIPPERCVVIEDSSGGLRAALGARMTVIAVATTHSPEELEMAHALVMNINDVQVSINDPGDKESPMRMTVRCKDQRG
jgi:sugar-phosphatase